jgi:tol-pal system protein YbgF
MLKHMLTAILVMAVPFANAQVQIIDSQPIGGRVSSPQPRSAPAPADAAAQAEIFFQIQALQQEVLELRGLVEQQSFELRQLKQQRMDDYLDLDRRLSQLSGSAPSQPVVPSASTSRSLDVARETAAEIPVADGAQANELAAYRTAIDLVLKQRDFDGGSAALQQYLKDFPAGHYAGNSLYWLGQISLQKNDSQQSKRWFQQLIDQHPNHQKTPEAKFKLAKLYFEEGQLERAKKMLQEVAGTNSAAAGLAKDFLQQNF